MPLTPGGSRVPRRGCIDPDLRIDALASIINEFGAGPAQSPDDPIITPVFANEDGDLVNPAGDIIVGGTAYTAGCGIDVTGSVISAAVDGSSIICSGGVLSATGSPTVTLIAGAFIDEDALADDDTIAVYLSLDKPGLEGDGETPEGLRSMSRFVLVKGQLTAAVDGEDTGGNIDNVVAWIGENPTDLLTDELPVTFSPRITAGDNTEIWAVYDAEGDMWHTGTAKNETYILRGKTDYASSDIQLLGHTADGTIRWKKISEWLELLEGYDDELDQSIGHDISAPPEWQDDDLCEDEP